MSEPIRAVYDCMILVQAAARPARVHATLQYVRRGQVSLYLSPTILEEVSDVLTRPEVQAKFPELRPVAAAAFLKELRAITTMVNHVPEVFRLPRDPKDEPYINLAIAFRPCCPVTWNEKHLTYLMRKDTPEGVDLCDRFSDVSIVAPTDFIQRVQSSLPE